MKQGIVSGYSIDGIPPESGDSGDAARESG
jgi:hypothetical protein